jgi:hypothetical protein
VGAIVKRDFLKFCLLIIIFIYGIILRASEIRAQGNGVISSVDTPGMAEGVWVEEIDDGGQKRTIVYVADGTYGIQVIDPSDNPKICQGDTTETTLPCIINTLDTQSPTGFASKVWIEGDFAYIADGPSFTETRVVTVIRDGQPNEEEVEITTHGFRIINLTTGEVFEFEDEKEDWPIIPDHATDVAVVAGFAYIADQESGLHIVNVQDLSQGWYMYMLDTPGSAEAVVVKNKLAFIADGDAGLQIVDVIKPSRPVIIGSVDTPGHAEGIAIKDNLAFIGDGPGGGLQIVNISNPRQPSIIASVAIPGRARGIAILDNLVFVASGTEGVQVVDITNLDDPHIIASFATSHFAVDIKIKDNLLYVADNLAGLQIIDISGLFGPFISFSPISGKVSSPMDFSLTIGDLNGIDNIDAASFLLSVNNGEVSLDINDLIALINSGVVTTKSTDVAVTATVPDMYLPYGTTTNIRVEIGDLDGRLTSSSVDYQVVNRQPVAVPGTDQIVKGGSTVTLDGSGSSDPDGDALAFSWSQLAGPSVTLSDNTSKSPTFTAPTPGDDNLLIFQLIVNDGQVDSKPATVNIRINQLPIANAGVDQKVKPSDTVMLDGSNSSDPEGNSLTVRWTQTAGPTVTLSDPTSMNPTFVAPQVSGGNNVLTFQLTVNDGIEDSEPDTVNISINRPPIANAGSDQTVEAYALVTLDGSGSSDPDNDPLTYQWTQLSGTPVTLTNADKAHSTFFAPRAKREAVLTFQLIVNDGLVESEPDTVAITIPGKP